MEQRLIDANDLAEMVSETTWYHINKNGELVEGAEDRYSALYKAEDIYKLIENAPTVEPHYLSDLPDEIIKSLQTVAIDVSDGFVVFERKRPQGEWLEHENHIECDQCRVWFLKDHLIRKSFCPNCGADMKGKK